MISLDTVISCIGIEAMWEKFIEREFEQRLSIILFLQLTIKISLIK